MKVYNMAVDLSHQEEIKFSDTEFIVSKTDIKGVITYVNKTFTDVSGYKRTELLNQPHNIIRHKAMPMCVFKLLWTKLGNDEECFAYVINQAKDPNKYYRVLAYVTPDKDEHHNLVGYHSFRTVTEKSMEETMDHVYDLLNQEEAKYPSRRKAIEGGTNLLVKMLGDLGFAGYDEFIHSLINQQ